MKRTIIKFSVLLMIFLLSGVGSALALPSGPFSPENVTIGNMSVLINYNGTGRPGDVVNITADFNKPVANATISITNSPFGPLVGANNENLVGVSLPTDALMTPLGSNELGGDSFGYDFDIPDDIFGFLGVVITPFGPGDIPLDPDGNLLPDGTGVEFPGDGFGIDPYIDIISPTSEFANESCVDFNFTANDYFSQAGSDIVYTFSLDGVQVNNGIITSGEYKLLQFTLADGKHTWEVQTNDSMGAHTTGVRTLYVDTQRPIVTLTSPQDCFKQVIGETQFNFTCEDALADQYSELGLSYIMYVDGQVARRFGNSGTNITGTVQSGAAVNQKVQLTDGAHNWSVSAQDGAGNNVTSEVRKFYVDLNGLRVSSLDPNNGKYVSANPTFNFTVAGGKGLPFNYRLLVDGKEIMRSNCDGVDCNGGYTGDEGENGCNVCCSEDGDLHCFVVGSNIYSLKAAVSDGVNKNWTVIVSDITTGKEYQTSLQTFSVDSVAPCAVEQLYVADLPGETNWTELTNSPGLAAFWVPNEETDLASTPYEVFISTSKPSRIEDMEKVGSTAKDQPLLPIENCSGKPLVYGKDYWVAVIARDNASNYDKNFSVYGPVQTYEDMNINLTKGWNLKSVPKRLVDSCTESIFGPDCTVLYWDGSCWQFPDTIEPCKGYWVYANKSLMTNVKLKGMSSDSVNPDVPPSLTLCPGWHMIGQTTTYASPWSVTLASLNDFDSEIADDYRFSNLITYFEGEGWGGIIPGVEIEDDQSNDDLTEPQPVLALQSYGHMVPGQGYWIFMKNEGTYASIENVYNLNIGNTNNGADDGTGNGGLPDGFDPMDPSTWPGFDPSAFQN